MLKNMSNFLLMTSVFGLISSCAMKPTKEVKELVTQKELVRVKHLALQTGNVPKCHGACIGGSSTHESLKNANKKVYFLYGAEHLKLDNLYFDIPVVYNKQTKKWIKYFTTRGRKLFSRYSGRAGRYAPVLSKILHEMGMPRDLIYLAMAESGFHNNAKSWAKAVGPWQFMPRTAKSFGLKINWYVDERRDPIKATKAAGTYLSRLYNEFKSWELAMAGYNAGEGKVRRAIRRYKTESFWKIIKGRYLKPETKNYVPKIMALAIIGKNLKAFGFEDSIEFKEHLDFDEVKVKGNADLFKISQQLNVDFDALKILNPELRRWQTPDQEEAYSLRIPAGMTVVWNQCCAKDTFKATDYQLYVMRGHGKLKHVARKVKVKAKVLAEMNNISLRQKLKPKTIIKLPFRSGQTRKEPMYADLYEKPRRSVRRKRKYRRRLRMALRRGKKVRNPSEFYIVKKGDTLWHVARRKGVSLDTIIKSNYRLVKRRMILPGDKLAIR
jgi:membrane-bound lytic murein transglycosylase D